MVVIPDQCQPVPTSVGRTLGTAPLQGVGFYIRGSTVPQQGGTVPLQGDTALLQGVGFYLQGNTVPQKGVLYPNNWVLHPYKEYSIPLKELRQNVACYPSIMLAFPVMQVITL